MFNKLSLDKQEYLYQAFLNTEYQENDLDSEVTRAFMQISIHSEGLLKNGSNFGFMINPEAIRQAITNPIQGASHRLVADVYINRVKESLDTLHKAINFLPVR